jgi:hypothetical protein
MVQIRYPEIDKGAEAMVMIAHLDVALSNRYGKPHAGSANWEQVAAGTSLRSSIWYGKGSQLTLMTFWNLDTLGQTTSIVMLLDGYSETVGKLRGQKVKRDM